MTYGQPLLGQIQDGAWSFSVATIARRPDDWADLSQSHDWGGDDQNLIKLGLHAGWSESQSQTQRECEKVQDCSVLSSPSLF